MPTAQDIVDGAYNLLYISPTSAQRTTGFTILNDLIAYWVNISGLDLSEFASLSSSFTFDDEYRKALKYNLAIELAPTVNKVPSEFVILEAFKTKSEVFASNKPATAEVEYDEMLYRRLGSDIND